MIRWVLVLAVLLIAPSTALARQPVISYVDGTGSFRLYDEEIEADVEPPPPVPANFIGFRHGMSHNGRFIVFNDADKKLHLLDRATNTQLPLPGIDVYATDGPGNLSVSNAGLIAFDKNGNGPALVYDSGAKAFVDTGLAANNGHRQTRLSGDGHFLATTCNDDNCIDNLGSGADPYVQDLTAPPHDTAFPADSTRDEEHPCIDGDGSRLGFEKRTSAMNAKRDIFLFDRGVSPPAAVPIPGVNDAAEEEVNCVLDGSGRYLGFFDNNTAFRVYDVAAQKFLVLDKPFDERSVFSDPYTPPPPGGGPSPPGDITKPKLQRLRMTHRRFRAHRHATAFRFRLSEAAEVTIVITLRGNRVGHLKRAGLAAGANRIFYGGRIRGRRLRPNRYVAVLVAKDAAGNRSAPKRIEFRVLPRAQPH